MINRQKSCHIITIEDPIEFMHANAKSLITQRELYLDVPSFPSALRDALREDPDVILVGEMRDLDTMRTAIMAAETGHLVFSTLHSRDAVSSLHRMISVFPFEEQAQIRIQLAGDAQGGRLPEAAQKGGRGGPGAGRGGHEGKHGHLESDPHPEAGAGLLPDRDGEKGRACRPWSTPSPCSATRGLIDRETALKTAKSESVILCRLERESD